MSPPATPRSSRLMRTCESVRSHQAASSKPRKPLCAATVARSWTSRNDMASACALHEACQSFSRISLAKARVLRTRMVRGDWRAHQPREFESGFELLVDQRRDAQELVLAQVGRRDRVAAVAVDPVEHADVVFARVAKGSLALPFRFGADIKREATAGSGLIHEQGHRAALTRQKPPADQRHPDRSEEHTSELQSQFHLVCRLLL